MTAQSTDQLVAKKCLPCEGGVEPYSRQQVETAVRQVINTSPALLAKIKTILGY